MYLRIAYTLFTSDMLPTFYLIITIDLIIYIRFISHSTYTQWVDKCVRISARFYILNSSLINGFFPYFGYTFCSTIMIIAYEN